MSKFVGSGNCVLSNATYVNLAPFDAIWASPPCQLRSSARTQGQPIGHFTQDYLKWCLGLVNYYQNKVIWIENVTIQGKKGNDWGKIYNLAQFQPIPLQNRNRIIGGRYKEPNVLRPYQKKFPGICPAILASEYKGSSVDKKRASRFYGRRLTLDECAYHQDFVIPKEWHEIPSFFKGPPYKWRENLYEAIGNGVSPLMSRAFGAMYP